MSCSRCPCSADLADEARRLGIFRLGVARAEAVDDVARRRYRRWIDDGFHASMDYMERYPDLRDDPRLLLDGARSVIVAAVSYHHLLPEGAGRARLFAEYARGTDYHIVVRRILDSLAAAITGRWGGETRVTVDTAPIRERYWAERAGLGFIGRNSQLIIPGAGSRFFLGTVITTVEFEPDAPVAETCLDCGRCVAACPGGAIVAGENRVDARRCLSYLTIEHRGDFPDGTSLHGHLYGCDVCQDVCPHNAASPLTPVDELNARPAVADLTPGAVAAMTQAEFSSVFRKSAVKRAKLAGLQRNARSILGDDSCGD